MEPPQKHHQQQKHEEERSQLNLRNKLKSKEMSTKNNNTMK